MADLYKQKSGYFGNDCKAKLKFIDCTDSSEALTKSKRRRKRKTKNKRTPALAHEAQNYGKHFPKIFICR